VSVFSFLFWLVRLSVVASFHAKFNYSFSIPSTESRL